MDLRNHPQVQVREMDIKLDIPEEPIKVREMSITLHMPEEPIEVREMSIALTRLEPQQSTASPPRHLATEPPPKKLDGIRHLPIAALAQDIHNRDGRDGVAIARMREVRRGIDKLIDATLGEYRADGTMSTEDASGLLNYIADALADPGKESLSEAYIGREAEFYDTLGIKSAPAVGQPQWAPTPQQDPKKKPKPKKFRSAAE